MPLFVMIFNTITIFCCYDYCIYNFKLINQGVALIAVGIMYVISRLIYKPQKFTYKQVNFKKKKSIYKKIKEIFKIFNYVIFEEILFKLLPLGICGSNIGKYKILLFLCSSIIFYIFHYRRFKSDKNKQELIIFIAFSYLIYYKTYDIIQAITIHVMKNLLANHYNNHVKHYVYNEQNMRFNL